VKYRSYNAVNRSGDTTCKASHDGPSAQGLQNAKIVKPAVTSSATWSVLFGRRAANVLTSLRWYPMAMP